MSQAQLRVGGTEIPVIGPRLSDSRLHLASIIITIHVLGQVALDFKVSVVHILVSIGVCFVMDVVRVFATSRELVWPASAMLTGSGVALILRLPDAEANAPWATDGWHIYLVVAALSLLSKDLIRFRGSHVFNPSNVVLVLTFLVLGSERAEPLDFWWAPLGVDMLTAYAVILGGGLLIAYRLRLLGLAIGFWATLAAGLGALSLAGHCITTLWSLQPVCDLHFWWVVVTSPETMIFLFFMITDPKTVPASGRGRVAFGASVAVMSTLLMAPASTEFGAKVGLLGGLAICSAIRPLLTLTSEWWEKERLPSLSMVFGTSTGARVLAGVPAVAIFLGLTIIFGASARTAEEIDTGTVAELADPTGVLPPVDPATLPVIQVDEEVLRFDETLSGVGARELAAEFVWLLQVEAEALRTHDETLLRAVNSGRQLSANLPVLAEAVESGTSTTADYDIESMRLVLVRAGQRGVRLGFEITGGCEFTDVTAETMSTRTLDIDDTYVLTRAADGRIFISDTVPTENLRDA